ncbi:MAG: ABC transporter permease [Planctomycetota bacterium]|nr:MAG: ABC transporter permease [Planctomycetota bacterium]
MMRGGKNREDWKHAALEVSIAFIIALLVGGVFVLAAGRSPFAAYGAILRGAFGSWISFSRTILAATPLVFTGLAFAFAMRGGLFNIGIEGQVLAGAFVAAWVGSWPVGSGLLLIPLAFILAAAAAGAVGLVMALLRVRFGASEVITGIMLFHILNILFEWLMRVWAGTPGAYKSPPIAAAAHLPGVGGIHIGCAIALAMVILVFLYERYTSAAFKVRAVGADSNVSRYQGINVGKVMLFALGVSGAMAGLAGASRVLGESFAYLPDISGGAGWLGIAVALVARNNPLAVVPVALLFGVLKVGGFWLEQELALSSDLTLIITMTLVLTISARRLTPMLARILKTLRSQERGAA